MNGRAKPPTRTRVQIDLAAQDVEHMNWLMDVCGLESRKDVFKNALTVLDWIVSETMEGRKVASYAEGSEERAVLSMPIIRAAAADGRRYAGKAKT